MSTRQLSMLRAMGWRYSSTREAWVHRVGRGSRGPVFQVSPAEPPGTHAEADDLLFRAPPPAAVPPMPVLEALDESTDGTTDDPEGEDDRRSTLGPTEETASWDLPARPRPVDRASVVVPTDVRVIEVEASLSSDEPARPVRVDGRPPTIVTAADFDGQNVRLIKPPRASSA